MSRPFARAPGVLPLVVVAVSLALVSAAGQAPARTTRPPTSDRNWIVPRTPDGHPDLQGIWNAATITPLERPAQLAGKPTLSETEATAYAAEFLTSSSLDRRDGGAAADRSRAYPNYFTDRGTALARISGAFRTSLMVDPPDGRLPPLTPEGQKQAARDEALRVATSDAGEQAGAVGLGIYDNPETRPLAERCLLSFGSSSGPPSLPVLYNNFKQIVQTKDHVMILVEMVHDARIIPFDRPHAPKQIRRWMGDSVARWEGDTLVIDTTNFTDKTRFRGSTANLHVVERFTRVDRDTIVYRFTVDDPATWTRPWTGEYPWVATDEPLYEYACHEANYAFGGILRGARLLEKEAALSPRR
jgi:hypothetical protein